MDNLDHVITELRAASDELRQSNDAAERRDFFRKYPWLAEADFQRHKASEARIAAYYSKPAAELNRDLVAAHDETVSRGWSAE